MSQRTDHERSIPRIFTNRGDVNGCFNEFETATGEIRPHWRKLAEAFGTLGVDEVAARSENARQLLREHGVSCYVQKGERGVDEPWRLDPLPFVISNGEWAKLVEGLTQRVRLWNLVLQDLYGVHRLVRDGIIPAPLLFANPNYLRACQAIPPSVGNYLHVYSVDLGRTPAGEWYVLADRSQAPTGIGFTLENRAVVSRILPEVFEQVRPRPITDVLLRRRETLRRLAPVDVENPTLVLLTPGPRNEAYFEHAYLARLLSLTLVEGDDLTVRDRRVYLKTLEGLRPVGVLLRRVSDAFCDPLELRGDSALGVPGLVEATRAGGLIVANALGSSLIEGPAFLPFLPVLSRHLLGEELKLPSLPTWWRGHSRAPSDMTNSLDNLSFRAAFGPSAPSARQRELSASEIALWKERVEKHPQEWVSQAQPTLSAAPHWNGHAIDWQPIVLRLFVLFDGRSHHVLPGGMARVIQNEQDSALNFSLSGPWKDVWVNSEEQNHTVPTSLPAPPPALEIAASDLPSRTADNFYWLGRYTERLENTARTTRCAVAKISEATSRRKPEMLAALARILANLELLQSPPEPHVVLEVLQAEMLETLYGTAPPDGIHALIERVHLTAFSVRYRLSADTWRIVSQLGPDLREKPGDLPLVHAASALNTLLRDLAAFSGLEMENMTRGHSWVFLDLGRRIERAMNIAGLLRSVLSDPDHGYLLDVALEIADSSMTYRRRHFSEVNPLGLLDLLVAEVRNPRSLAFQFDRIREHVLGLQESVNPQGVRGLKTAVTRLVEQLEATSQRGWGTHSILEAADILEGFLIGTGSISELLNQVFFSHALPQAN